MQHRWLLASAGALALACSSDDLLPYEPPLPLLACVDPAAQVVVDSRVGRTDFSLAGRVEEVGSGVQDPLSRPGCAFPGEHQLGSAPAAATPVEPSWARVRSSDDPAALSQVSVFAPDFSFAGLEGEALTLRYHAEVAGFAVAPKWLELRRADGALLFWLAEAQTVPELVGASEIQRTLGPVSTRRGDECMPTWEEHSLDVGVGPQHASVPPRQRAEVGGMAVTNSLVSVQTSETTCLDYGVAYASAAAWLLELDADH